MKKYSKPIVLTLAILLAFALVAALAFASQITAKKIIVDYVDEASNTFNPGDTIEYVMTVTNPSGNTATNTLTRIWDTLPDGTVIEFLDPGETLVQAPGQTDTFYADYVVDWADVQYDTGTGMYFVTNKFEAEGKDNIGIGNVVYARVAWNSTIVMPPLEVEKTAVGTYDRTVTWELDKTVNGKDRVDLSGAAGDTFGPVDWKVVATKYEEIGNYKITGTITIHNPAAVEQDYIVADVLDDGTPVVILGPASGTILAGATLEIPYEAFPDDGSATENTATVTAPYNPPQEATAEVGFTENLIGDDEVTLADDRYDGSPETISASTTWDYEESFTCSADAEMYTDGKYSAEFLNPATLDGPNTDLDDSAMVTIECELPALQVSKTAAGSYDRTVEWTLDKTVNGGKLVEFSGIAGETFGPVVWKVVATKSVVEDNHKVAGTITIINPAAVEQDYSVTDVLDDGTAAVFLDPASGTIAAGATLDIEYEAFPDDDSAELNTATVTAPGNPPQEATAPVDFTENLIGDDEVTLADDRSTYSDALISASTTWTYEESFTCSADASNYTDGKYTAQFPNTATLKGDNTDLVSSAEVTIECVLPEGEETAWARMYDQPYNFTHKFDGHPWFSYLITRPNGVKQTFYFYAGQYHRVGEVDIWKEGNMLRIDIRMDQGYTLVDSKVNVQRSLRQFHRTPWAPGSYPYTGGVSFAIPWGSNWNNQDLTIAIHGNVRGYFD